jgi:FtsP/CotA-like multicopper oxidase with cupredoxin domain
LTSFHVEAGKRYRFRLINAASNVCPFIFQIENHNFTIIATAVSYVRPTVIDTLYIMSGERFDFVVDTRHKEVTNYWLRFKQLSPCTQQLQGFAILKYQNGKVHENERSTVDFNYNHPPFFNFNYPQKFLLNTPHPGQEGYAITYLKDFRHDKNLTSGPAEQTKWLFFDTPGIPNDFVYNENVIGHYICKNEFSIKYLINNLK